MCGAQPTGAGVWSFRNCSCEVKRKKKKTTHQNQPEKSPLVLANTRAGEVAELHREDFISTWQGREKGGAWRKCFNHRGGRSSERKGRKATQERG